MPDIAAIVLAAGSGSRMGDRKQFLDLTPGERLVDRTVTTCRANAGWVGVVLPPGTAWAQEDRDHRAHGAKPDGEKEDGDHGEDDANRDGANEKAAGRSRPEVDSAVEGGADRLGSVVAGVAALPPEAEIVVVHSASHPLASVDLMARAIAAVEGGADGVVPILPVVDTIKRHHPDGSLTTLGREGYGTAQGPMVYRRSSLDRALTVGSTGIGSTGIGSTGSAWTVTEESMAVEAAGGRVIGIDGELTNLHVTDRASLAVVRHLATLDLRLDVT